MQKASSTKFIGATAAKLDAPSVKEIRKLIATYILNDEGFFPTEVTILYKQKNTLFARIFDLWNTSIAKKPSSFKSTICTCDDSQRFTYIL